ncbi:LysR substrate-binding domain-containing protein [Nitrosophilus kaiyonis]|uniref:LysR substrate-binding domain-containing protein n=1 Tax=Nitrosophilus kaiyonis TaxID=2930200 RepID=UPI0024937958|nr:LysR substrate-binding domain-containing protein [Nitrosophilus kaiyonis]
MRITLRQMEIFLEVAKIGHLTQVAKDLGLSQSAVSMSLKELESTLGCKLFDRIQKKLVLNEKGRAFKHAIEPLVKKLRDIEEEFMSQENKGELSIGASTTIADYIMPHIVCEYMEKYPEVKIKMKIGNTSEITKMVEEGDIDIGYIEGEIESLNTVFSPIGVDELVIVTGDKSLVKKKEYFIDNLLDYKWVLREEGSGTRSVFFNKIKNYITGLNLFLELRHTEAIKSVLKEAEGTISCISKIAVNKELENKELYEIKVKGFDFTREFYQIHHKDKYKSDLFKKFSIFARYRFSEILKR